MSGSVTQGFDIIAQINEAGLNELIEGQQIFPGYTVSINRPPVSGELHLYPHAENQPTISFTHAMVNGLSIYAPYQADCLDFAISEGSTSFPIEDFTLTGALTISHPVSVFASASGQSSIGFDFGTGISLDNIGLEVEGYPDITYPIPRDAIETLLREEIQRILQDEVGQYEVFSLPVSHDDNPYTLDRLDVTLVDESCLVLGAETTQAANGNITGFTHSSIPSGSNTTVIISNRLILEEILAPEIMNVLELDGDLDSNFTIDADGTLTLNHPADISGYADSGMVDALRIDVLSIHVQDNELSVSITASAEGPGYSANATVDGRITGTLTGDNQITLDFEVGDPDIHLRAGAWIPLIFLGFALFPLVVSTLSIVLPVVLERILNRLTTAIDNLQLTFPLPPLPITLDSFSIDDITLPGTMVSDRVGRREIPSVWLDGTITCTDAGDADTKFIPISGAVTATSITFNLTHEARFTARTKHMVYPVQFDWFLGGERMDGTGTLTAEDAQIEYSADEENCSLKLSAGSSFKGYLRVVATDSNGPPPANDEAERWIEITGTEKILSVSNAELLEGPVELINEMTAVAHAVEAWERPDDGPDRFTTVSRFHAVSELENALREGSRNSKPFDSL